MNATTYHLHTYTDQPPPGAARSVRDDKKLHWQFVASRRIRPTSSLVLDEGKVHKILSDCRDFLSQKQWYSDRGIPHRRGYLLYGPPGTGKSSLVTCVAGALKLPMYVLTLTSPRLTDHGLRELLNG